ncbi:hypothetical protein BRADI_1g14080v3 [Brachypodium distachyon]|uniref:Carboxypeptidase n=1 Tax=Brachypodium distachyon TaxID=15368 RepID=A0A0Q3GT46_BRADI|nr:hypothetical protein BRADI_1g14080v3 [Brachypodium distachyon]
MKNFSLYSQLLLVCVAAAALRANASHSHSYSQEARLKEFISSRRTSNSSSDAFRVRNIADRVAVSLSAESSASEYQSSMKAADKITALLGQPEGVDFNQYSGYVTVDEVNGRALFYYLTESPSGASEKPLVLWLNGGPGCSSLAFGAMQELGPFRITQDNKTLTRNMNAWNNVANVIFLDSPAGVGFSYSNTSSDYDLNGDERTADDTFVFLVNWLERFPEYKDRAFYISGESYAGHYVPELAATILFHNTYHNRTIISLKGILVGNAYLDINRNIMGTLDFFWTHGVMSDEVYANITRNCDIDILGRSNTFEETVTACVALDAFDPGQIDAYNIYAPVCIHAPNRMYYPSGYLPGYDPCSPYAAYGYLNNSAVQHAFHARTTKWGNCAGDFDAVCPLAATRFTIQDLGLPITTAWRPWTAKEEVGGYVQQYAGGFTFLSVRGAGHMVPSSQPERVLIMLSSFLKGILPPYIEEQQ